MIVPIAQVLTGLRSSGAVSKRLLATVCLLVTACDPQIDVVARAEDAAVSRPCTPSGPVSVTGARTLDALANEAAATALCTCEDVSAADLIAVLAGDTAVDGAMSLNGGAELAGELRVAGAGGIRLGSAPLAVGGALRSSGSVLGSDADVTVGADGQVGGRVQLRSLTLGGTLTLPEGAALDLLEPATFPVVRGNSAVRPTCPCSDDDRIDAAALRDQLLADDSCFVTAEQLSMLPGPSTSGLLVIDGDLRLQEDLSLPVPAGETLDLVVLGNLSVNGPVDLGGDSEGRVRLFVTGNGTITLEQGGTLHGLLHAPNAELVVPAPLDVRGALAVRRLAAAASLTVDGDHRP